MKEIIKSIPMVIFVVFVLGITYISSVNDAKLDKQKDLQPTKQTSQIVITNK